MVKGFQVTGFGPALLGALIVSVTNLVMVRLLLPRPRRATRGSPPPMKRVN